MSAGVVDLLSESQVSVMTLVVMAAQKLLRLTSPGREYTKRVLEHELYPPKARDQVILIYQYVRMAVAVLMSKYITLAPVVLAIPELLSRAKKFREAYNRL